jgi:SAM-dependent methyltransferase
MENTDKETFETWNAVASLYEERFMELELYNETYDLSCDLLTPVGARILEIGCGPGNISKYLLTKRPDFDLHGIDIASNMISLAKKNNPAGNFSVMDTRDIGMLSTSFDGIIGGFCLPYLSSGATEKLIADSFQLLNKNGILYLSFVEGDPNRSGFQSGSTGLRSYFYYHSLGKIEKDLGANHFKLIKIFNIEYKKADLTTDIHTIVIAQKKVL